MTRNKAVMLFITILFAGIFLSQIMGIWESESTKVPNLTDSGEYDPGDIRGSYTFGDVENAFGVPVDILAQVFSVSSENPEDFQIKNLKEIYAGLAEVYPEHNDVEIGNGSVKFFVKLYTGIESDLVEPEYIPLRGLQYLLENQLITQEIYDTYEPITIDLNEYAQQYDPELSEDTVVEEEEHVESIVKGNTTVQEVIDAGMTLEELEEVMGISIDNRAKLIKDLCTENELAFMDIKNKINEILQK